MSMHMWMVLMNVFDVAHKRISEPTPQWNHWLSFLLSKWMNEILSPYVYYHSINHLTIIDRNMEGVWCHIGGLSKTFKSKNRALLMEYKHS